MNDHVQKLNTTNKGQITTTNTKINLNDSVRTALRAQSASISNTNYPNAVQNKRGNASII
jgi:hypothetical protein